MSEILEGPEAEHLHRLAGLIVSSIRLVGTIEYTEAGPQVWVIRDAVNETFRELDYLTHDELPGLFYVVEQVHLALTDLQRGAVTREVNRAMLEASKRLHGREDEDGR